MIKIIKLLVFAISIILITAACDDTISIQNMPSEEEMADSVWISDSPRAYLVMTDSVGDCGQIEIDGNLIDYSIWIDSHGMTASAYKFEDIFEFDGKQYTQHSGKDVLFTAKVQYEEDLIKLVINQKYSNIVSPVSFVRYDKDTIDLFSLGFADGFWKDVSVSESQGDTSLDPLA